MMKATETRYYYNANENLCADEEFAVYFLCEMEGLTAEEAREGLRTKREFYGWFDTASSVRTISPENRAGTKDTFRQSLN